MSFALFVVDFLTTEATKYAESFSAKVFRKRYVYFALFYGWAISGLNKICGTDLSVNSWFPFFVRELWDYG